MINTKVVLNFLDNPQTGWAKAYTLLVLLLIYSTVIIVVIEYNFPDISSKYSSIFTLLEYLILLVFTGEYLVRIFFTKPKLKYIFSFYGIIDLLAILPSILSFTGLVNEALWLRILKIVRLVRILKFAKLKNTLGRITNNLLPFFALIIGLKGILVIFETQDWWPKLTSLNVVIGVVGFALAILLGTKLRVVNSRIFAIEDAICRIAGALRDMQNQNNIKDSLLIWSKQLEFVLKNPEKDPEKQLDNVKQLRNMTDELEVELESSGIGGPNTAGFHRDVAYLLHRITACTPESYEKFLKHVVIGYIGIVVFSIPGLTGLVSSILVIYVLGGMYFLIDDMDNPLDYSENSQISVRLDALEFYNNK